MEKAGFNVVEFEDATAAIIPTSWVSREGDSLKCYWHSSKDRVIRCELPNPLWKKFNLKRIAATLSEFFFHFLSLLFIICVIYSERYIYDFIMFYVRDLSQCNAGQSSCC